MSGHILVIDEGTTSTRAMLFALDGACLGSCQRPLTQHYPARDTLSMTPQKSGGSRWNARARW